MGQFTMYRAVRKLSLFWHLARSTWIAHNSLSPTCSFPIPVFPLRDLAAWKFLNGLGLSHHSIRFPLFCFRAVYPGAMEQRASAAGANLILQKAADTKQMSAQLRQALLQLRVHCREWLR
jgi:hypothetical protein